MKSNKRQTNYAEYKLIFKQGEPYAQQDEKYFHISDDRTPQQIALQSRLAEQIYKDNLKTFHIQLTAKKKIEYAPSQAFKVEFSNKWYAIITDNYIDSQNTIFTVHGSPGDHRQWAGLETEMNSTVRWINFIIPGFDGQDERRGDYTGSVQDLSRLILMVLQHQKVNKIVYCGHSMGSIFASYFITKYPQVVKGYINVTGIVNQWYRGLLTFYRTVIAAYGFGRGPNHEKMIELINQDQFRKQHYKRFLKDIQNFGFSSQVPFPQLKITQMCAYIKLFSSIQGGCSQFYQLNRNLKILKFLIFGKKDPLHEIPKTNQQIYSITLGKYRFDGYPQNSILIAAMKQQLQKTVKEVHGIEIKAQKIQQYFCYHFDDTGHNAHKRRPKQISAILKVYLTVINIMQKYRGIIGSKL